MPCAIKAHHSRRPCKGRSEERCNRQTGRARSGRLVNGELNTAVTWAIAIWCQKFGTCPQLIQDESREPARLALVGQNVHADLELNRRRGVRDVCRVDQASSWQATQATRRYQTVLRTR